jgi:hypothetical protein
MPVEDHPPPEHEELLKRARKGERESLGQLLEFYRNYLTLLARLQIDRRLQGIAKWSFYITWRI